MPPPVTTPAPLKLLFTTTSLRNVTIASPSDEFYYEVVTQKWDPLHTKIRRLDPVTAQMESVAEMKMEGVRSKYTGLRFTNASHDEGEVAFNSLESFFQPESGRNTLGRFTGNDGKRYQWQIVKGSIELFQADKADAKSLARFHAHHRHFGVLRMSRKPYLSVDSALSVTLDNIIVSFLIAEGKRRRM